MLFGWYRRSMGMTFGTAGTSIRNGTSGIDVEHRIVAGSAQRKDGRNGLNVSRLSEQAGYQSRSTDRKTGPSVQARR